MVETLETAQEIIVVNEKILEGIKKRISKDGFDKFHIVADFDRTLTKAYVNGEKIPSLISILRNGDYISEDYARRAHELADKYRPIEMDVNYDSEKKRKKMYEWWRKHFDLLIESGLNRKHIESIVKSGRAQFREGVKDFLNYLNECKIPLVIISSTGLGSDSISMFLEYQGVFYDNIHIVSNQYEWDEDGNAVSVREPLIHVMNKDETTLDDFPFYKEIKDRRNVLLLGDSLGDEGMIEGFSYSNLIKVGFLNEDVEKNLGVFKYNYDVVLTGDQDFNYVNELMEEMFNGK